MSEAWGAIIAAVAAGVFTIIGILTGIYVGRRQTADQATVEHGQWLRGQRQEAYVQLLDAWEKAIAALIQVGERGDNQFRIPPHDDPEPHWVEFLTAANKPLKDLQPFLERVKILGPDSAESAADDLMKILTEMRDALWQGFNGGEADWVAYRRALTRRDFHRDLFVTKARDVMRAAPRPGGR